MQMIQDYSRSDHLNEVWPLMSKRKIDPVIGRDDEIRRMIKIL